MIAADLSPADDYVPAVALPSREVRRALKQRGVSQRTIARRARVSAGYVSLVLARATPLTPRARRVWRVITRALAA